MSKYSMSSLAEIAAMKPLLFVSVIIFNSISIVTTAVGFSLVWRGGSQLMSWGFALAVGLMLVHLTLEVAAAGPGGKIWGYVSGYAILAAVSIFFNFNAFFGKMTANDFETNTSDRLASVSSKVYSQGVAHLRTIYRIEDLELRQANALAGMKYEEKRPDIPGSGPRYRKHLEEYEKVTQQLLIMKKRYQESVEALPRLPTSGGRASQSYEVFREQSMRKRSSIRDLISVLEGQYRFHPILSRDERDLVAGDERKTDLWYSLVVIADEARALSHGDWRRPTLMKVSVALLVSFIIDVPIFVAVVFSHRRSPLREDTKASATSRGHAVSASWEESPAHLPKRGIHESEKEMWAGSAQQSDAKR